MNSNTTEEPSSEVKSPEISTAKSKFEELSPEVTSAEIATSKRKSDFEDPRPSKKSKARQRGLQESALQETQYYFEGHLRKVYPYRFVYSTHCKGRWVDRELVEVFSDEFRAHSRSEHEKNIAAGNICVNGEPIAIDYKLKDNDRISNLTHRHETAVVAAPIKIIHSDDEFVIVDKPPSIPIHPCGRYRHNSLVFLLAKEHGLSELYSVHRLDRLTSGLVIFARTVRTSQKVNEQIRERQVQKEYVCRVVGNFPGGTIQCTEPIDTISPKTGISMVSASGKPCQTIFEKVSYNGRSSVVRCRPKTGRMHQIRVHLQFLGHPIVNDHIYNHDTVFGPLRGKNGDIGKTKEQLLEDILNTHNLQKWLLDDSVERNHHDKDPSSTSNQNSNPVSDQENRVSLKALEHYIKSDGCEDLSKKYARKEENFTIESTCDLCHQKFMDPEPKDMIFFLHCLRYKGIGWEFETELPPWATADWDEEAI